MSVPRAGRPSVPPHMKSQPAATTQRSKCWIPMLNTSEPDGLPGFHIANIVIQFIKTRPKSPMSLIVLLPRGTVVRICENPPHHSQNPSSRVQPSLRPTSAGTRASWTAGSVVVCSLITRSELAAFGVDSFTTTATTAGATDRLSHAVAPLR